MCTFKQPAASTLATPDCLLETDFSFSSLSPFLSLLFSPNSSVVIGKRGFSAAALESSEDGLASSETHGTFTVLTVQSSLPWQRSKSAASRAPSPNCKNSERSHRVGFL